MKTLSSILLELTTTASLINTELDVGAHQPVWDIFFSSAQEFYRYEIYNYYLKSLTNLEKLKELVEDIGFKELLKISLGLKSGGAEYTSEEVDTYISLDIDNLAKNEGLTRKAATYSTGYERFYFRSNSAVTIEKGTQVQTSDATPIVAETIEKVFSRIPTYDNLLGLYYIEVGIKSINSGVNSNIGINNLNVLTEVDSSIIKVSNPTELTGGKNIETDIDFLDRIIVAKRGRELATNNGLKTLLTSLDYIDDAKIVCPPNSSMVRYPVGAIDIYVKNRKTLYQQLDTYSFAGAGPSGEHSFLLTHVPISIISSVKIDGVSTSLYSIEKSYTSYYRNSNRASEYIKISTLPTTPCIITIEYLYDYTFVQLHSYFSRPENEILASDILIKRADEVLVNITINVTLFSEYNSIASKVQFETNCNNNLSYFFNGGVATGVRYVSKKINENIDISDIIVLIGNMKEVDRIDLSSTTIEGVLPNGTTRSSISGQLAINDFEYAALGSVVISYTD